jgi:diguanylate cyclase (GGDEF)-like protein
MRMPSGPGARRALWVGAAFSVLIVLGAVDFFVADVDVGVLAIVPLFAIAGFAGRRAAIPAAIVSAIVFAAFHDRMLVNSPGYRAGIFVDALVLAVTYIVTIELVEHVNLVVREKSAVEDSLREVQIKAERDPLTGLPNRAVFMNRLQFLTGHSTTKFAVLFADLDRFKECNDTYGHEVGDRILLLAGHRVSHALRANDFVARIGGDEFAVLLYGIHDRHEVDTIVRKIEHSFVYPFVEADENVSVGITLGASYFPEDSKNAEALMRIADERMYARKPVRRSVTGVIGPRRLRRLTRVDRGD